jgi:hypothetical protein
LVAVHGQGRVGDGQDDVAGDRLAGVGAAEQFGGVAALGDDAGDGPALLLVPMMLTCAMGCS